MRDRIRTAYDPSLLRTLAERMGNQLADHLSDVYKSSRDVLNWNLPEQNIAKAKELSGEGSCGMTQAELSARFQALVHEMLQRGHNLHDPRYMGHQVPAPVPIAGLFDAVGSVTNQVMAIYEMGPWATAVEQAMVQRLAEYLNWEHGRYAGFVTHGATLANLNALLVARNVALADSWNRGVADFDRTHHLQSSQKLGSEKSSLKAGLQQADFQPSPVLVVQADAHYSIARSAGILGLGTRQVVKIGLDERRRMNVEELDQTLQSLKAEGRTIVAVVACACSTPIGAFDPLNEVADVCQRHNVWLHVDAAHGGSALTSARHRHLVDGLERADSLVWDAHKMLFVPALCAFLFFKNKQHSYEAFQQNAPYLFDPCAPDMAEYDLGLRTVECTKRAAAFGLWGTWSLFGPQLFSDLIDVTFALGQSLYEKLKAAPDFETIHEPQCNIVAFRYLPATIRNADLQTQDVFQRQLRRRVIESGAFYLVAANIGGKDVLRVTLINPLTTDQHLDQLLDTLRDAGRAFVTDTITTR